MSKSASESTSDLLALTPGEPAGIGPDIALMSIARSDARLLVVADPGLMASRAKDLGINILINDYGRTGSFVPERLNIMPVSLGTPAITGRLDPANAGYVLNTLEAAVTLCESHVCSAMITGPVNKAVINEAGIAFTGHTEWLAERTGTAQVVMMLATSGLKVALVTTHLPLRAVADAITQPLIERVVTVLHHELQSKFGIVNPQILVLGLNPHAGENGHLGLEEIEIIKPAIEALSKKGIHVTGPLPADTAFTPHRLSTADVVLAMFHDQGLPVLKYKGFGSAANITLGLPIIRT
ncbi:MAG: 4-hydroxythreonine-4-phosphate dehydrogenase PdxA, partial [Pseudomonadales bacterium]